MEKPLNEAITYKLLPEPLGPCSSPGRSPAQLSVGVLMCVLGVEEVRGGEGAVWGVTVCSTFRPPGRVAVMLSHAVHMLKSRLKKEKANQTSSNSPKILH